MSLVIISVPEKNKHYVIRMNPDCCTLIGDITLNGTIIGIANTYEESLNIYNNLNY